MQYSVSISAFEVTSKHHEKLKFQDILIQVSLKN